MKKKTGHDRIRCVYTTCGNNITRVRHGSRGTPCVCIVRVHVAHIRPYGATDHPDTFAKLSPRPRSLSVHHHFFLSRPRVRATEVPRRDRGRETKSKLLFNRGPLVDTGRSELVIFTNFRVFFFFAHYMMYIKYLKLCVVNSAHGPPHTDSVVVTGRSKRSSILRGTLIRKNMKFDWGKNRNSSSPEKNTKTL